jgi:hypothetical protein
MEWLHHLPEGVNLSTKFSDEALELWRCTWVRQVTLGGMASIRFSDVPMTRYPLVSARPSRAWESGERAWRGSLSCWASEMAAATFSDRLKAEDDSFGQLKRPNDQTAAIAIWYAD